MAHTPALCRFLRTTSLILSKIFDAQVVDYPASLIHENRCITLSCEVVQVDALDLSNRQ